MSSGFDFVYGKFFKAANSDNHYNKNQVSSENYNKNQSSSSDQNQQYVKMDENFNQRFLDWLNQCEIEYVR